MEDKFDFMNEFNEKAELKKKKPVYDLDKITYEVIEKNGKRRPRNLVDELMELWRWVKPQSNKKEEEKYDKNKEW